MGVAVVVVSFFISELAGYIVHKLAHWPKTGLLYETHLVHHFKHYPPKRYTSKRYLGNLRTSFIWWFIPAFLLIGILAWCILPLSLFITALATMSTAAIVNTTLHDSFHVENHWLKRFKWHQRLVIIHYIHHINVKKNLGIYFFFFDVITNNFKNPRFQRRPPSWPFSHPSSSAEHAKEDHQEK